MKKLVATIITTTGILVTQAFAFTANNYNYILNFNDLTCNKITFQEKQAIKSALDSSQWLVSGVYPAGAVDSITSIQTDTNLLVFTTSLSLCETYKAEYQKSLKELKGKK